jgi:arylsulfatase
MRGDQLKRRNFIKIVSAVSIIPRAVSLQAKTKKRPNFLLILVDDMGYSDLGCMGGEAKTPHLDKLSQNGLHFTQMYNTAKCFPTRACLLTGVYFQQTDKDFKNTATIGEVLRPIGYRTLWSGKHHSDFNPRTRGFDRFSGLLAGFCNFWNPGNKPIKDQPFPGMRRRSDSYPWAFDDKIIHPFVPDDPKFYTTDAFTDWGLEWLDEYSKEDNPFFLYMAYTAPHWPLHAWPEDIKKYKGVYDQGFGAVRAARYKRQKERGLFDPKIAPLYEPEAGQQKWDDLTADQKKLQAQKMEVHTAMVDRVDQNVGRLINKLKR